MNQNQIKNNQIKSKKAFSLIELSIVLLIITLVVAVVVGGQKLMGLASLSKARALTNSSPVNGIEDLTLWLETTTKNSFLDAERVDGGFVTTWRDINPQNNNKSDATQTGATSLRPTYVSNGINGLPALQFAATKTNFLNVTKTVGDLGMDSGNREYFIVLYDIPSATYVGQKVPLGLAGAGAAIIYLYNAAIGVLNITEVTKDAVLGPENYIINVRAAANGDTSIGINALSDQVTNMANGGTIISTTNTFYIGRSSVASPTYFFDGKIGEIIMFNRTLSNVERKDVKQYLSKKWRIPLA